MKMGSIPSLSLPPITTCRADAPCTKDCYSLKPWRQYPSVRKAWQENLDYYNKYPSSFFDAIYSWFETRKKPVDYFRWNVGGDFPSDDYLQRVKFLAKDFPATKFLAFTKRYEFDYSNLSPNTSIVFSVWPGLALPEDQTMPRAYMDDGTDGRIPLDAMPCPGNCTVCGACWELAQRGINVVFKKH